METFQERLRTAMLLRGVRNLESLALVWNLPLDRVRHLLAFPEEMLATEAAMFRANLGVRAGWLLGGKGAMLPMTAAPCTIKVLMLLNDLQGPQVRRWLKFGLMLKNHPDRPSPEEVKVLDLFSGLSAAAARIWLRYGKRLEGR